MKKLYMMLACAVVFAACRKADVLPQAANFVSFENELQGIDASEDSATVPLLLRAHAQEEETVVVNFSSNNLQYGVDFTTVPAASGNSISITIPPGNSDAFFLIKKIPGRFYDGDEHLDFTIYSSSAPLGIGTRKNLRVSFSEILAQNAAAVINGGGVLFPNKVFVDLSANRQTAVQRTNWDLGFATDASTFRVILNSSSAMMAKQLNKTDLNSVSVSDTVGISGDIAFSQFAPTVTSLPYIDYPNGDLARTAIAEVSATADNNKVYIVNRGQGIGTPAPARGWKKIRVLQNNTGGYTLQYANIDATSFEEIQVPKTNTHFFNYVSFENGLVNIEPAKTKWDLAWTFFSNVTNFGSGEVPYLFQDVILSNRNVSVAQVLTSTKSFAEFSESDLTSVSLSSLQTVIGSSWRSGGGPSSAPSVRTDRYYIVKDGDNNVFKIRFTALTQNGQRGYPAYEAVLVKAG